MKCPACHRSLKPCHLGPVELDVCDGGCGGVWFDAQELDKVNQAIPAGKRPLDEVVCESSVVVDQAHVRKCARCRGVKLERRLFSLGTGVIMDCCPQCHGIWLDHGELDSIREETNPMPRPVRNVVSRRVVAKNIPVNFGVLQQVQTLRVTRGEPV